MDFVKDNTPLPAPLVDDPGHPPQGLPGEVTASTINDIWTALDQVRDHTRGWVNVKLYGLVGDGFGDDTAAFNAAANAASAAGLDTLYVPTRYLTINGTASGKSLRIVGNGTVIQGTVGAIHNHGEIVNCVRRSFNTSQPLISGKPSLTHRYPMAVFANTANQNFVFVTKNEPASSQKYALLTMLYNNFTASGSEATNSQSWRLGQVTDIGMMYVMLQGAPTTSGVWTPTGTSATALGPNTAGGPSGTPSYWAATVNGAYMEWANVKGPLISVGAYTSTTGSLMTVSVDGVNVGTFSNAAAVGGQVIVYQALTSSGLHTVRVTHSGAGGQNAYLLGVNFFELKDAPAGLTYDKYWYGRDGTTYQNFIKDDGGQEYAIFNNDKGTFAGGYHGGETYITAPVWRIDGVATSLSTNDLKVGQSIAIEQNTNIAWSGRPNDTITLRSISTFYDGALGFAAEAHAPNGVNLTKWFTNLTKTNPVFSQVIYPLSVDCTNTSDPRYNSATGYFSLGRTNKVVQREPATGRMVTSWFTLHPTDSNPHGGVFIWKVDAQYYKVYYGATIDENRNFTQLAWEAAWLFS